jgi:hypothetical protein
MSRAGLGREMHDKLETVLGEQGGHSDAIGKIELGKAEAVEFARLREARVFQLRIVIGVQIVEPDNLTAILQQPARDVEADESGRTRY